MDNPAPCSRTVHSIFSISDVRRPRRTRLSYSSFSFINADAMLSDVVAIPVVPPEIRIHNLLYNLFHQSDQVIRAAPYPAGARAI